MVSLFLRSYFEFRYYIAFYDKYMVYLSGFIVMPARYENQQMMAGEILSNFKEWADQKNEGKKNIDKWLPSNIDCLFSLVDANFYNPKPDPDFNDKFYIVVLKKVAPRKFVCDNTLLFSNEELLTENYDYRLIASLLSVKIKDTENWNTNKTILNNMMCIRFSRLNDPTSEGEPINIQPIAPNPNPIDPSTLLPPRSGNQFFDCYELVIKPPECIPDSRKMLCDTVKCSDCEDCFSDYKFEIVCI